MSIENVFYEGNTCTKGNNPQSWEQFDIAYPQKTNFQVWNGELVLSKIYVLEHY